MKTKTDSLGWKTTYWPEPPMGKRDASRQGLEKTEFGIRKEESFALQTKLGPDPQ